MSEPMTATWQLLSTNMRAVHDAAAELLAGVPATIDEAWQGEGVIAVPIAAVVKLRKAMR